MVLWYKEILFHTVDGLALDQLVGLRELSRRGEVPLLVDGDLIISESADIVDYLEDVKPHPTVYPGSALSRAEARRWQRLADREIDAILHDISLWIWPTHRRDDTPPPGLLEIGRSDLYAIIDLLEHDLGDRPYICGALSVADFALQPHFSSLRLVGVDIDEERYPCTRRWLRRMRALDPVGRDLDNVRTAIDEKFISGASPYEGHEVVWRGDRIEWLLARGFDEWWMEERRRGRAVVPSMLD